MSCCELFVILKRYSEKMEFNSGCSQKTLEAFQEKNGIVLPLPLAELLTCFDGGELFVPGTVVYGTGANGGESLKDVNRREKRNIFKIPNTFLVFAKVNYGDFLCIDMNNNNEVIQWDHELDEEGKKKALDYIHLLIVSGEYKNAAPVAISTFRELKLFDMPVSAGPGTFLDSEDYELIKVGNEVPEKTTFGVKISGNSMEPRYLNQQIVWIQQTEELVDGEIGIFLLNGNAYCKKLQNNSKGLALISLNPEYAPIKISEQDQFHIFGRVLN